LLVFISVTFGSFLSGGGGGNIGGGGEEDDEEEEERLAAPPPSDGARANDGETAKLLWWSLPTNASNHPCGGAQTNVVFLR
jgi:hypothetical protein